MLSKYYSLNILGKHIEVWFKESHVKSLQERIDEALVLANLLGYQTELVKTYNNDDMLVFEKQDNSFSVVIETKNFKSRCYMIHNGEHKSFSRYKEII